MWFRQLVTDFFELLYNAAGLTVDTLRTFFLVVLAILGPLSFALSIYDGFQSTYQLDFPVYKRVPVASVADIFSAVLSKIQALMLESDVALLQDPSYIPDSSNGVYIVFLIIGIIGYFSVPTVAEWIIQSGGGASGAMSGINRAGAFTAGVARGIAGNVLGAGSVERSEAVLRAAAIQAAVAPALPTGRTWQHRTAVLQEALNSHY